MNPKVVVMMVDDNERFCRRHAAALEGMGDVKVIFETDPRKAAAMIRDASQWPDGYPELFLLDIVMPEVQGGELAQIIRDVPGLRDTPIVFFTASDLIVTREEVLRAGGRIGGEDFLTKGRLSLKQLHAFIMERTSSVSRSLQA